jgi:hypothetical protein
MYRPSPRIESIAAYEHDLQRRIARLERSQRRLQLAALALFAALAAFFSLGMSGSEIIRAKALHLMDDEGNLRVLINARAGVSLLDEQKRPRAVLSVDREGPGLALYGTTSQVGTILNVNQSGPALAMRDNAGHTRALLAAVDQGPALILSDANERERAVMTVQHTGPALSLMNESGRPLWRAPSP